MTTRAQLEEKGINLNTIMIGFTMVGMIITGAWFIFPLRTLPEDIKILKYDQQEMAKSQIVQTSALKTLAEVAGDTKQMRRDVDSNFSELKQVKQRLEWLEKE